MCECERAQRAVNAKERKDAKRKEMKEKGCKGEQVGEGWWVKWGVGWLWRWFLVVWWWFLVVVFGGFVGGSGVVVEVVCVGQVDRGRVMEVRLEMGRWKDYGVCVHGV